MAFGAQGLGTSLEHLDTRPKPTTYVANNRLICPVLNNGEKFDSALRRRINYRTLVSWLTAEVENVHDMVSKGRKTVADAARLFKVHSATVCRFAGTADVGDGEKFDS